MLPQLKNLPQRDVDASTLSRWLHRQNAWLNVVLHHWCGYDHTKYPQKPTTIFTNLDCLPPMPCCRQTRQALGDVPTHSKNVKDMGDDEKAAWPTEFVEVAIRAAVEEVAVMKAKKLAMKKASAITRNLCESRRRFVSAICGQHTCLRTGWLPSNTHFLTYTQL